MLINKIDQIFNVCQKSGKSLNFGKYIQKSNNDKLPKIKELITVIVNKEKSDKYTFVKFETKIWIPYLNSNLMEELKLIRKIIFICKEVDMQIDEDDIELGRIIHDLGLELIRFGELKGDKLVEFLGEDETFYYNKKIKYLEQENEENKKRINNLDNKINYLEYEIKNVKKDVSTLRNSHENLEKKVNDIENKIDHIKSDVNSLYYKIN